MPFHSALLLFVFTMSFGCSKSQPTGPVVIGHLHPSRDEDEIHGIALAVEAINADPAKHVTGRKLKVVHADGGSSPDEAQGQTVRLLTIDKVDGLVGISRWSQAEKMGQAAQSPLTVGLSLNGYAGNPAVSSLFPIGVAPSEQGRALARHAKELKGTKAIVLKEADTVIPGLIAKSFGEHFGETGNSIAEHTIKPGEAPDYLKELGKPDVIVLCGSAKQVLLWRSKLVAGPTLLFGGEEAEMASLLSDVDPAKQFIAAASFYPGDDTPAAKEFVRQFQEKHGKPPTIAAALAHDAVNIWAEAARRANSTEPEKVREQLSKKDAEFEVLTGKLSFVEDHSPRRPVFVVRLTPEKPHLERRYDP
jgi:branched-chain amino acid transport system substrate-binding protein